MAEEVRQLHLLGALGSVRTEVVDGREHLVVPCIALMQGVIHAVNAETPEFVSEETLRDAAASWNGKPVTLGHPVKSGKQCSANDPEILQAHGIGILRNSKMNGTKLGIEALIDPDKLRKLGQHDLEKDLRAGKNIEVSVGALVSTDQKEGSWLGKVFKAAWRKALGDHLAFLPGGRGACSIEMGCGAHRAAMHLVTAESIDEIVDPIDTMLAAAERFLALYKLAECETCEGTGQVSKDGKQEDCPTCKGEGEVRAAALKTLLGSRHSSQDMATIQAVHDHTMKLGAQCDRTNYKLMEEKPRTAIKHEGGKWTLYSTDGSRRLGSHNTEVEAEEHRSAIEKRLGTAPIAAHSCKCGGH